MRSLSNKNTLLFLATVACVYGQGLSPKKYNNLPLGAVKPAGWISDQLNLQVNGLGGRQHEFYKYVAQGDWNGAGSAFYSDLEEAGSYWFNGLVPTGILSSNTAIQSKTQQFLDYVLSHQGTDGWLGPEVGTNKPRWLWGRYPFMFGAIQFAEAHPDQSDKIVTSLYKFVNLANTMLKNNQGVEVWTKTRWQDFVVILQWLYDFHPNGNEALLLDTMQRLKATGNDWGAVFSDANFPKGEVSSTPLTWHGVNVAEGLKALAASYRFTHNQADLTAASQAWDRLFQYHGRPSGHFAADEYLAGLEAVKGAELCLVVELMFSGSYLYQVIGDLKFADRIERVAYNSLPASLTGDMWARQYLQQQNQIAAKNMNPNPFKHDGAYSNVFGLDPNYPCCTVNHPQGWPKFISHAFMTTPDLKSLVQVYHGPFSVSTKLANGNAVTAKVDTLYPFSDTVTTTITAQQAYTHLVRIPGWVVGGTISINGGAAVAVSPSNGLQSVQIPAGTTKFTLNLPAPITTESRPHGAVSVLRGPLVYALDITRSQKVLATNSQQSRAVDLEFDPTGTWQYAINRSTLKFNSKTVVNGTLPSPVFDAGLPPVTITAAACTVSWGTGGDLFANSPPQSPATCTSGNTTITLWPYGAAKLHISDFPTFG